MSIAPDDALHQRAGDPAELLIRGAHVLDPGARLDEPCDVLIRRGKVAEIGAPGSIPHRGEGEVIEAIGKHAFPAFVDPHVHLREPGQEHKTTIDTFRMTCHLP